MSQAAGLTVANGPSEASSKIEPAEPVASRSWGKRFLAGLLLGVIVWAGLLFYGDSADIFKSVASISLVVLGAILLVSTLNYAIRAIRWQLLLREVDVRIPVVESSVLFLSGLSMTLTPMKAGEILKSVLLKQSRQVSRAVTAPVVLAERVTDLAALVLLVSLGSLALEKGLYIAAAGAGLVLAIMIVCTVRPVGEALLSLLAHVPKVRDHQERLREAYLHLGALLGFRSFLVATALSLLAWGAHCWALLILVHSFPETALSIEGSLLAYATPLLAGSLSMLPGGLGLTEASMTGFLRELAGPGMTPGRAAATTILIRLVTFWWAIAVGLLALFVWRRRYTEHS